MLHGSFDDWALHSAITAKIEAPRARAALALNDTGWWNALFSGEATLDIFTLATTVDGTSEDELGASASVKADVTDEVTLWGGARWVDSAPRSPTTRATRWPRASTTSSAKRCCWAPGSVISGPANAPNGEQSILAATAKLTWEPGGGYTGALEGVVNSLGGYKTTLTAEKTFE